MSSELIKSMRESTYFCALSLSAMITITLVELNKPTTLQEVPSTAWSTNFYPLEEVIKKADVNDSGKLVVDKDLLSLLELASSKYPETRDAREKARIEKLMELSHPLGKDLSRLLQIYRLYNYKKTEIDRAITMATGREKLVLLDKAFERIKATQSELFGEKLAAKIFQQKNKTHAYLYTAQWQQLNRQLSNEFANQ